MIELAVAVWRRRMGTAEHLLIAQMVMFTGVAAIFPVVPLYVAQHHGGSNAIAAFVAGPMIANTIVQLPAGHLVDRLGAKRILLGSRLLYAAASLLLFLNVGSLLLLGVWRCLQGVAEGAYVPGLNAVISETTDAEHRTARFAQLQAVLMVGLLIGPAIGGAIALWRISGIFLCSGLGVLLGMGPLLRLPDIRPESETSEAPAAHRGWWRARGVLVPAIALFCAGTLLSMYDVVWPQYMTARGYNTLITGLTISLYAVPILLLAGLSGRVGDRADRRLLLGVAFLLLAICVAIYPSISGLGLILGVGAVEACAEMLVEPNLFAVLSNTSDPAVRGRVMGLGGMFQFAGSGLGAGLLGALYGLSPGVPFYGAAGFCLVSAILCALLLPRHSGGPAPNRLGVPLEVEVRG